MGKVSVDIGNYKRVATVTFTVVASGVAGPTGAVKAGSDSATGTDIYVIVTALSWVKV